MTCASNAMTCDDLIAAGILARTPDGALTLTPLALEAIRAADRQDQATARLSLYVVPSEV